jgi:hypothetical protein
MVQHLTTVLRSLDLLHDGENVCFRHIEAPGGLTSLLGVISVSEELSVMTETVSVRLKLEEQFQS